MAASEDANRISLTDADGRGISELIREAAEGRDQIIVRDDTPVAVVISAERYDQLRRLQDDLIDITLAASRVLTTSGESLKLDEVLQRFGFSRKELAETPEAAPIEPRSDTSGSSKTGFRRVDPRTHPLIGRWRIVETDMWDSDYIDLVEPGYIAFDPRGQGEFAFGAVTASLDLWYAPSSIDFTWRGSDEGDEVFGDGSAELDDDGNLIGEIRFGYGDETEFKARPWSDENVPGW